MKKLNPPGRFLKKDPKDPNKWIEIDDKQAKQKAKQALRDCGEGAREVRAQISTTAPAQQAQGPGAVPLVPPESAPAVAAAGGNAVTPLTLSPASSTATAAPGALGCTAEFFAVLP